MLCKSSAPQFSWHYFCLNVAQQEQRKRHVTAISGIAKGGHGCMSPHRSWKLAFFSGFWGFAPRPPLLSPVANSWPRPWLLFNSVCDTDKLYCVNHECGLEAKSMASRPTVVDVVLAVCRWPWCGTSSFNFELTGWTTKGCDDLTYKYHYCLCADLVTVLLRTGVVGLVLELLVLVLKFWSYLHRWHQRGIQYCDTVGMMLVMASAQLAIRL